MSGSDTLSQRASLYDRLGGVYSMATLEQFSVPPAEQAEIKALVESIRAAIVVPAVETVAPLEATEARPAGPQDSAAMTP